MNKLILLITLLLSGCISAETPVQAAERAIEQNDFRLYKLKVRGNVIPGISVKERSVAAELCGTQWLEGSGDVIRSESDRNKHHELMDYAKKYNRRVYASCKLVLTP